MEKTEGLVIELDEHHMVVMCDDGMFRNLPLPERLPRIGERVMVDLTARLAGQRRPSFISRTGQWTKMISAAAVLLLVLISATFWQSMGQNQAFGMVNVDINPSVNLYFDEKGMIIKIDALNGDGEKVTESLGLLDKSIVQAIPLIWESALSKGYLHDDRENAMMVSVVPLKHEQERSKAMEAYAALIKQELRTGWEQQGITGYIEVLAVDITVKEAAEKTKVSVNKYILQQEAMGMGMVIQDEELDSSIYEIVNKGNLRQFFEKINGEKKKDKPNHATQGKNSESDRDSNNNEGQKPDKHPKEQDASDNPKSGSKNEEMKGETPVKKESGKSPKQNGKPDKPSSEQNPNKPQPKPEAESDHQSKGTPQSGVPTVDYKKGNEMPDEESEKDDTDPEEDGSDSKDDDSDNSDRNNGNKNEKKDNKDSNEDSEDNDE